MAIRKIARMGHPILRQKGRTLTDAEIQSPQIRALIEDMKQTMREYGGIGLAAPQVHESLQLALVGINSQGEEQEAEVFINPVITVLDKEEQGFWEGCLSIPDLRGLVFRPRKIRVDYKGLDCKPRAIEAEGFRATVFQHELDHLAGVLFVDRIQDMTKLSFVDEYERYWIPKADSGVGELSD